MPATKWMIGSVTRSPRRVNPDEAANNLHTGMLSVTGTCNRWNEVRSGDGDASMVAEGARFVHRVTIRMKLAIKMA